MAMKIGELMIKHGLISPVQLDQALVAQRTYGGKLGTNLVELGFVSDLALAQFLSKQLNLPAATPKDFESIQKSVLDLVPRDLAEKHMLIPLRLDKKLVVGISDPADLPAIDELGFKTGKSIQPMVAPEIWIIAALERHYGIPRSTRYVMFQDEPTFAGWDGAHAVGGGVGDLNVGGVVASESSFGMQVLVDRFLKIKMKEDVFGALMDFLAFCFPRMAIYIVRKDQIVGWMVRGFPVHVAQFQKVQALRTADTTVREVLENQRAYAGAMPARPADNELIKILGIPTGKMVEFHPILFRGKGAAVVLGFNDQPQELQDKKRNEIISIACGKAGLALELGAIRKAIMEIPVI